MWRKGNLSALLLGIQISTATVEKQYEVPSKKIKMELPFDSATSLLGIHPANPGIPLPKNICTSMFIAALFTIAKIWK